jgi:hypothetical protein
MAVGGIAGIYYTKFGQEILKEEQLLLREMKRRAVAGINGGDGAGTTVSESELDRAWGVCPTMHCDCCPVECCLHSCRLSLHSQPSLALPLHTRAAQLILSRL